MTTGNVVMWETRLSIVDWDDSKTQSLLATLKTLNQSPGEERPQVGCAKKQTSASHRSAGSEVISLDARLRVDAIPALDLWDVVMGVLHSSTNTHQALSKRRGG